MKEIESIEISPVMFVEEITDDIPMHKVFMIKTNGKVFPQMMIKTEKGILCADMETKSVQGYDSAGLFLYKKPKSGTYKFEDIEDLIEVQIKGSGENAELKIINED